MATLTHQERIELAKILRRYVKEHPDYTPSEKYAYLNVVDDFVSYGRPNDPREYKLLKQLIDEALEIT